MANLKELSDEQLDKKIESAKLAVERASGGVKKFAVSKLAKLEKELASRGKSVEKDVEKASKEVEKEVEKVEKDVEKAVEDKPKTRRGRKPRATSKPNKPSSPTEKFELVIDGKTFKFDDLKSKQECERAKKAVEARYEETKQHKEATKQGIERSKTVSVTRRISDAFQGIARKAVAEVPKSKIQKSPTVVSEQLAELESAFDALFDKIGALINKEIPKSQRKQIMDILTKFENKVDKGSDKKSVATSKVKKEDGGLADSGIDDSWSYASFL
jgi:hypothetical protein